MADSLQFLLSCQICLEDFEEDGDLIPRILPCSHTLCERCLIQLLGGGGGSFKCPECRAQHVAPSKEKSFPQNKYLLTVIKRRESREVEEPVEVRKSRNIKSVSITRTVADLQTKIFNVLPRYNFLHFQYSFPKNRLPLTPFGLVKQTISLTSPPRQISTILCFHIYGK